MFNTVNNLQLLHSSLNLAFRQRKLHNIFILGMTYDVSNIQQHFMFVESSIEHGGTRTFFNMIEQFDSMGVPEHFPICGIFVR